MGKIKGLKEIKDKLNKQSLSQINELVIVNYDVSKYIRDCQSIQYTLSYSLFRYFKSIKCNCLFRVFIGYVEIYLRDDIDDISNFKKNVIKEIDRCLSESLIKEEKY